MRGVPSELWHLERGLHAACVEDRPSVTVLQHVAQHTVDRAGVPVEVARVKKLLSFDLVARSTRARAKVKSSTP